MITNLHLLRNIGRFESVTTAANIPLGRLTLIYAENGQGKTTLAAILRSLATGDHIPIVERRRLAAQHPPHVVIGCVGGPPNAMFQNGVWNRTLPNMVVFDDLFVDQNVYSGLMVGTDHRHNLHELILGAQGVGLNRQLQQHIDRIEVHNSTLRQRAAAIPAAARGDLSVDDFCVLPVNENVDQDIQAAERNLAASREQDPVRNTPAFEMLSLPVLDLQTIERVLQASVPELDAVAAARVHAHLATAGVGAEEWISEGMRRQSERPAPDSTSCVFCAQNLSGSPVIAHYRAFFSEAYRSLKRSIADALAALGRVHNGDAAAAFERAVRVLGERRQFWSRFCEVPTLEIDTAAIARDWQAARQHLAALLSAKQASPLEPLPVADDARSAVAAYAAHRALVELINQQLVQANQTIAAVKQRVATANPAAIAASLSRLQATKARHTPATAQLCDAYLEEKRAKAATEQLRNQARTALERYRATVFPNYEAAINRYLDRFNAGFRLDRVAATNTRSGPACTYNVVINNVAVAVAGGEPQPGTHSFRNTLSAGDRNTLALAFFFASLELDQNLADKIVAIDDPVSSLDEHRSLTTVQELRRLAARVAQVIVLSHTKPFLCRIWEGTDSTMRAALQVTRDGDGSTIAAWNVDEDCVTWHDRRHEILRAYLANAGQNEREVASSIRPLLEAFLRVAYPEHFPPGTLLGSFRGLCEQRVNTPQEILNAQDTQELRDLIEYANLFHHEPNHARQTQIINAAALTGFVRRALIFARKR
ncbi:MAG: AAA family ATPase [Chthoniobacteraceae bacterium]